MSVVIKTTAQINTLLDKVDPTEAAVAALDTRLDTAETMLVHKATSLDTVPAASTLGINIIQSGKKVLVSDGSEYAQVYTTKYIGIKPGDLNLATKLNAKLDEIGSEALIQFDNGSYNFDAPININGSGFHLRGQAEYATKLNYFPSADGEFIKFSQGATQQVGCSLKDVLIYSSDTTRAKVAIEIKDNSSFNLKNIFVSGFRGKDSRAARIYGRENMTIDNFKCNNTDIALQLSPNPNTGEWLSVDHFVIRDFYSILEAAPSGGGVIPTTHIIIDDKAMISGFTMEGRNAWVGGQRGLYNLDTTGTMASYMIDIANCRREQASSNAYSSIHIERNTTPGRAQSVRIKNFYGGVGQKGIYARGVDLLTLDNTTFTDPNYVQMDIDNCTDMEWRNAFFTTNNPSLFVMPNMEMVRGGQKKVTSVYPVTASFQKSTTAIYQQVPMSARNGSKTWEYTGTINNGVNLQIPINADNGYKLAIVDLVGVSTDGTEFEGGQFAVGLTDDTVVTGNVTASTASTTVTITGGTFPLTIAGKKLYYIETLLGTIASVAGDGLSLTLSANSLAGITGVTGVRHTSKDNATTVRGVMKLSGTAKIAHTNTAGSLLLWCNSGSTAMKNNMYIYNRIGKDMNVVLRATFY